MDVLKEIQSDIEMMKQEWVVIKNTSKIQNVDNIRVDIKNSMAELNSRMFAKKQVDDIEDHLEGLTQMTPVRKRDGRSKI